MSMLTASNLCKRFRRGDRDVVAVDDVSLALHPGDFVAVTGPSGCGKTTLLSLLGTLETPDTGAVMLGDRVLHGLGPRDRALIRRRDIGFVFQDLNLLPTLTALENVALPLELDGWRPRPAYETARSELEALNIGHLADSSPSDLSGGQRQRVAVARAMAGNRQVLLADEPCGSLDTVAGDAVMDALAQAASRGIIIVMVTHSEADASWADRILRMHSGRLMAEV